MFDWNNYLKLAEELANRDEEQCKRSAVSRAYYAVFGQTNSYLKSVGLSYTSRDKVHSAVWKTVGKLSREGRKISAIGDRLKLKRQKVDYEPKVEKLSDMSKIALKEAQQATELLKKLSR